MSIMSALYTADYSNQTKFEYLDDAIADGNYENIKTLEYEVNWYRNYLYPTLQERISIGDVVKWICGEKDERYFNYMDAIQELKSAA